MNRMVPLAALVNWNYRPRWGFEGLDNSQKQFLGYSPCNWLLALGLPLLAIFVLPVFLNSLVARIILGVIFFVLSVYVILTAGHKAAIAYVIVLALLYPLIAMRPVKSIL